MLTQQVENCCIKRDGRGTAEERKRESGGKNQSVKYIKELVRGQLKEWNKEKKFKRSLFSAPGE